MSPDSTAADTVVLVRHGETAWNRTKRIQGWAPVSLTDRGREQARALGQRLAQKYDIDRVVASDLRRTRETTALLREGGIEPSPTFSQAWRERSMGDFQGLTAEEVFDRHPEYSASTGMVGVRSTPDGGESLLDLRERVLGGWRDLFEERDDTGQRDEETVLVVTHGGPIYVMLGHTKELSLPRSFTTHSHDNCAVTELRVMDEPGEVEIIRENETVQESERH